MIPNKLSDPISFKGVMVSSTFEDMIQHRASLADALRKQDLFPISMEDCVPEPNDDLISSSLRMVGKASAYIGLIGLRYGQVPECPLRNPNKYSITRLEFEQAQLLERPTIIFIMGNLHLTQEAHVELDPDKRRQLEDFRQVAKKARIYHVFNSLDEFSKEAIHLVASLRRVLDENAAPDVLGSQVAEPQQSETRRTNDVIMPRPPALYAEPPYIGSHSFLGRQEQIDILNCWASAANPNPVLVFQAIGGVGKSFLTWEWIRNHAPEQRKDWAGYFWYSFYERGASAADFCRQALAYMTGRSISDLRKATSSNLYRELLEQLRDLPWILVIDGLERLLVGYHRVDSTRILDEEAGTVISGFPNSDPCACIRPDDEELLRGLAGALRSKILLTSRLVPRAFSNRANQPISGVVLERLPGLRPIDAEKLIRACGVRGTPGKIQTYLQFHCDCHPLVIGVIAGLVNDFLPDRGNFDAWSDSPIGGVKLSIGNCVVSA